MAQFLISREAGVVSVTSESVGFEANGATPAQRFFLIHNPTRAQVHGSFTLPTGHVPEFEGIDDGIGSVTADGQVVNYVLNPDSTGTIVVNVAANASAGSVTNPTLSSAHGTLAPFQRPDTNQVLLARYH